jgi:DNA (cytosine-5)-methyltransferase 1
MKRLQTFPEDVRIIGSIADAQRQLGNAVPSLLAEILAREIKKQLLGSPPESRKPTLELRRSPTQPPAPEVAQQVPNLYLHLRGSHPAHPGAGRGYRATATAHQRDALLAAE